MWIATTLLLNPECPSFMRRLQHVDMMVYTNKQQQKKFKLDKQTRSSTQKHKHQYIYTGERCMWGRR
jgi:hypothetical protein